MIYVWRAVQSLGRATPEEVMRKVAIQLGMDTQDKNLKRNIYRDLKDFADHGDLHMDGFTPDGTKIDPGHEDEFKNIRLEYYIPGDESHVPGGGMLLNSGYRFIPQKRNIINWSVGEIGAGMVKNHMLLVFSTQNNLFFSLNVPIDELPAKVVFARKPGQDKDIPSQNKIEELMGARASLMLCADKTVSRSRPEKIGHAVIDINSDQSIIIRDLGSSAGTFYRKAKKDMLSQMYDFNTEELTQSIQANPFDLGATWKITGEEAVEVKTPVLVRLGDFVLFVANSNQE